MDKIYIVCYNKKYVVNIYDLERETHKYLFLKEYGIIKKVEKSSVKWYRNLEDTQLAIRLDISNRMLELQTELNNLLSIRDFIINDVPSASIIPNIIEL